MDRESGGRAGFEARQRSSRLSVVCEPRSAVGKLSLDEAAAVLGVRAPVSHEDLAELARACELGRLATNLDDEPGEWSSMRAAAREALARLVGLVDATTGRLVGGWACRSCGGRGGVEAWGVRQCNRCGALTRARGVR